MVRVCWALPEGGRGSGRTASPARAEPMKASGSPGDGSSGVSGGGDVAAHVVDCGLGWGQPRRVRPIPRRVSRVVAEADVGYIVYLGYSGLGRARESRRQRATGNGACQALLQSAGPFLTRRGSQVPRQAETANASSERLGRVMARLGVTALGCRVGRLERNAAPSQCCISPIGRSLGESAVRPRSNAVLCM